MAVMNITSTGIHSQWSAPNWSGQNRLPPVWSRTFFEPRGERLVMTTSNGDLCSRVGILVCALLLCSGCGDDGGGSGDGGASNGAGSGGGSVAGRHLEADLEATSSDSIPILFHCSLDYTVDIHGSPAETEEWVSGYLDGSANSVVGRRPLQAFYQEESLLSEMVTMDMMEGVVGLPGIYGTPTFDATCGDIELVNAP